MIIVYIVKMVRNCSRPKDIAETEEDLHHSGRKKLDKKKYTMHFLWFIFMIYNDF